MIKIQCTILQKALFVFDGIAQQIDQHLLNPAPVGKHQTRLLKAGKADLDAAGRSLRRNHDLAVLQHLGQRLGAHRQRQLA